MKKLLCIILAVWFCFILTACGSKKTEKTSEIDLEYYCSVGKIPESPYKLGDDPTAIEDELSAAQNQNNEEEEPIIYQVTKGEKTVRIDSGAFIYCYEIGKEKDGISYIADLSDAYGIPQGTVISEVKEKLISFPYTEREPLKDELFLLFGETERTVLEYQFEKRSVLFIFEENALAATILVDRDHWEY